MELAHDTVRSIAELAKLELTDAEVQTYAQQLSAILQYFEQLQKLDTAHIPPTASVLPLQSVMREDIAGEPLSPEEVVANAPDAEDNQFRVSAVLED